MKKTILSIVIIGFLFASCGKDTEQKESKQQGILVAVATVQGSQEKGVLHTSGKVEAINQATLSTRTMGTVEKVYVQVGDKVRKGQLLLTINNADLTAQKAQADAGVIEAKASFTIAEKDYDRFRNLFEKKSATQKELDDMKANYTMAKARLEGAEQMRKSIVAQFAYSNIKAPFNGIVTQKFINKGDLTKPGQPLIEVENPTKYEIVTMVSESDVMKIKEGTEVFVHIKSIEEKIRGEVSAVSHSAQSTGGQYLVKVSVQEKAEDLRSGMFTTVAFPVEDTSEIARNLILQSALVKRGALQGVYTISQSGTAVLHWLRLGKTYGNMVEVLSGLQVGETYITSADEKLYNGVQVTVQ